MVITDDFEYEIVDIEEKGGSLRVSVKHEYGEQTMGLSPDSKYLGDDGQPKWKKEVYKKLQKKYGNRNEDKSLLVTKVFQEEIGNKIKIPKE